MNFASPRTRSFARGSYEEYHPYGSTAWWAGSSATVSQKRYRFTGMERDDETGLQCHGVRYYATWLGRWVSADPIGLGDGVNRFGYCHGGVIGGLDSTGMGQDLGTQADMRDTLREQDPPDPLVQAAMLDGTVQGEIDTLTREIHELSQSRQSRLPLQVWDLEHYLAASGFTGPQEVRVAGFEALVDGGLAAQSGNWYVSTGFERAIDSGLIGNEVDQERFLSISAEQRRSVYIRAGFGRAFGKALAIGGLVTGGSGGLLLARAPNSGPAVVAEQNVAARAVGAVGEFRDVEEYMSAPAAAFQKLVTGVEAGTSWVRNSVKFDGLDMATGALLDAKSYTRLVSQETGEFMPWFRGQGAIVDQAARQLNAAGDTPVHWVFPDRASLAAVSDLLQSRLTPQDFSKLTLRVR